ncbi:MAG: thioredoxin [Firmicutes bacterium]|jgi:thioredoxin 1|nr:thioredoxin [Bacillota bacterium]HOB22928.1 thioredoxin [Bacillota bacterium]HQD40257.1 thioredoxin [Bacillota bacterium]
MLKEFNSQSFDAEVLGGQGVALVDFWAPWCGPCRALGPIIEELAQDYSGRATIGKVNVDENGELANRYGVMSIPTILLFKDGQLVDKIVGLRPKEELAESLDQLLG